MTEMPNQATLDQRRFPPMVMSDLSVHRPDMRVIEKNHVVAFDSRDIRSRPFNLMRTKFTKQLELLKMNFVGITSPAPTAGKSLMSLNLAAALARLNDFTVFLVDMDLRRGSIGQNLGIEFEHGVTSFLEGKVDRLEDIAMRIEGLPLVVLPTHVTSEDSTTFLSGERYDTLIGRLRAQSSKAIVIVDLPPVFANDDAMILMESLDGYMMVVDSGRSTKREVQQAMELLRPAVPVGAVLNRYRGGVIDAYGYGGTSRAYSRYYNR